MPDSVYANHSYSEYPMTGGGQFGGNPYGSALQPEPQPEPEAQSVAEPDAESVAESEPVDPGLLMSFLTDFRSAQYEEIRKKRMEELEKTKKGRSHRPVAPVQEQEDDTSFGEPDADTYGDPYEADHAAPSGDWSAPPVVQADGSATEPYYPASDADFQVAACKPEEPAGKRRFPLGLASFKGLGQSPATA